ncbi:MAG: hypothetical protein KF824_11645 [Fimbriimonadaceae bacterium]|nr:MAG: hypothetical protein KF824_11645 [Fimbriimonadaceae bacterium]
MMTEPYLPYLADISRLSLKTYANHEWIVFDSVLRHHPNRKRGRPKIESLSDPQALHREFLAINFNDVTGFLAFAKRYGFLESGLTSYYHQYRELQYEENINRPKNPNIEPTYESIPDFGEPVDIWRHHQRILKLIETVGKGIVQGRVDDAKHQILPWLKDWLMEAKARNPECTHRCELNPIPFFKTDIDSFLECIEMNVNDLLNDEISTNTVLRYSIAAGSASYAAEQTLAVHLYTALANELIGATPKPKICQSCGRWFTGRPNQLFCTRTCRTANWRKTRLGEINV